MAHTYSPNTQETEKQNGPSLLVAPSFLTWTSLQDRKRDCSSESGEQLQEDPGSSIYGGPRLLPSVLLQLPAQEQKDASSSESELEQEDHQGAAASDPKKSPSLSPPSFHHKRKWECSSEAPEEEKRGGPWCSDVALQKDIRLPPRKRWREYLSLMEKEQQESSQRLCPGPFTHMSVMEKKACGLKKKMKRKHLFSVLPEHHAAFTRLLEDPVIKKFLAWDKDLRASDKNLLAMVIAYFSRASLFPCQYRRIHFFLALYLANDMEEDDQDQKLGILLFLYDWTFKKIAQFQKLRYQFICCIGWHLRVTKEECEEIQAYDPALWVWGRDRTLIQGTLKP
ncbi:speedy protein E4-like [Octodon degus]|uniref:Speedy protein E4-like n=1 Tax=Octodon degus TaxID=10160 RepID=A0A6P3F3N7_OCTDE|nr:speedy protein E4-like [Octodon degus]